MNDNDIVYSDILQTAMLGAINRMDSVVNTVVIRYFDHKNKAHRTLLTVFDWVPAIIGASDVKMVGSFWSKIWLLFHTYRWYRGTRKNIVFININEYQKLIEEWAEKKYGIQNCLTAIYDEYYKEKYND